MIPIESTYINIYMDLVVLIICYYCYLPVGMSVLSVIKAELTLCVLSLSLALAEHLGLPLGRRSLFGSSFRVECCKSPSRLKERLPLIIVGVGELRLSGLIFTPPPAPPELPRRLCCSFRLFEDVGLDKHVSKVAALMMLSLVMLLEMDWELGLSPDLMSSLFIGV